MKIKMKIKNANSQEKKINLLAKSVSYKYMVVPITSDGPLNKLFWSHINGFAPAGTVIMPLVMSMDTMIFLLLIPALRVDRGGRRKTEKHKRTK